MPTCSMAVLATISRSILFPIMVDEAGRVAVVVWFFPWAADSIRGWVLLIMALRGL